MKRKPIDIIADMINSLNKYPENSEISIAEMSKHSESHYNTIKEYILLIQLIQKLSPIIQFQYDSNKIIIKQISPRIKSFNSEDFLTIKLFTQKIFDYQSAIEINKILNENDDNFNQKLEQLKKSQYIQFISMDNLPTQSRIYLKELGKIKAQGLLSSINRLMGEYVDSEGNIILDVESILNERKSDNKTTSPKSELQFRCHLDNKDNPNNGNELDILPNLNDIDSKKQINWNTPLISSASSA